MKTNLIKNMPQLNKKQIHGLFVLSLWMIALFAFLFLGADGYVLFDDSGSYINMETYMEGVMPLYPLFLRINRILFGEAIYLHAVIVEQAVFASACLILFLTVISKQFHLSYIESYLAYLLMFLPFTTDMPEAMTTQEILTEGIAYAAFYLFMAVLLHTVWTKSCKWMLGLFVVTLLLAATRSQLQILFGVCGVIFIYIMLTGKGLSFQKKRIVSLLLGICGCLFISLAGIWCTGKISVLYQRMLFEHNFRIQMELNAAQAEMESENGQEEHAKEDMTAQDNTEEKEAAKANIAAGQYSSLIFSRGMYEADYEDYLLFEDEELQELYLYLYQTADENRCLYPYAEPGLWMWKDIVGGIGSVGVKCFYAQNDYYSQMPEIRMRSDYQNVRNTRQMQIGLTLIRHHLGRALYHTAMLLPSAFICTVFFQVESLYFLCHLITLFLYLSAIELMIWAFADKKVNRAYAEFMAAVLGTNVVMVLIISIVFFGQQRYLVYNFGIFYVSYFLLILQLWKTYGKKWLLKWKKKKES